jgi:tRNA G18 (ribose-2'-O)-methylase SpoU
MVSPSMATKHEIKFYASLKQKKVRDESGLFIAEGRKIVGEGLKSPCDCARLFVREGALEADPDIAALADGWNAEMLPPADSTGYRTRRIPRASSESSITGN